MDIYHVSGHEGLNGAFPTDCWDRLTEAEGEGVNGSPYEARIRMIFGINLTRMLDKTGITVWGVRYHAPTLATYMNRVGPGAVDMGWHPSNIGVIAVRTNGLWHEISTVVLGFDGGAASSWHTAARHLRAGRRKVREIDIRTALDAMEAIRERSDDAVLAAGITMNRWSPERLALAESRVMSGIGFCEPGTEVADPEPRTPGTAIEEPIDP